MVRGEEGGLQTNSKGGEHIKVCNGLSAGPRYRAPPRISCSGFRKIHLGNVFPSIVRLSLPRSVRVGEDSRENKDRSRSTTQVYLRADTATAVWRGVR